jgi:hypothetical protein
MLKTASGHEKLMGKWVARGAKGESKRDYLAEKIAKKTLFGYVRKS